MTLGIGGTGPNGEIRRLREHIRQSKYEIWLISEGMKRKFGKKKHEEMIADYRKKIREIKQNQNKKKAAKEKRTSLKTKESHGSTHTP